jgi:hypothetical protein
MGDIRDDEVLRRRAYESGRKARERGEPETANPYPESGHPRDTTYDDEMHYEWWKDWVGDEF